jgi:hypothetical protein
MNVVFAFRQLLEEAVGFAVFAHGACVVDWLKVGNIRGSTLQFLYKLTGEEESGEYLERKFVRYQAQLFIMFTSISPVGPFHRYWRNQILTEERISIKN